MQKNRNFKFLAACKLRAAKIFAFAKKKKKKKKKKSLPQESGEWRLLTRHNIERAHRIQNIKQTRQQQQTVDERQASEERHRW